MTQGVNRVTIIGNLGRDPEVRYSQQGSAVCNLRLAVTERRKDGQGEWKDHTEWVTVVAFGKTAEAAGQYLQKGRQVYVDGRLQTRSWKDKDGVEKWSTEVVADQVLFLGQGGGAASGEGSDGKHRTRPARSSATPSIYGDDVGPPNRGDDGKPMPADRFIDDDLPF